MKNYQSKFIIIHTTLILLDDTVPRSRVFFCSFKVFLGFAQNYLGFSHEFALGLHALATIKTLK